MTTIKNEKFKHMFLNHILVILFLIVCCVLSYLYVCILLKFPLIVISITIGITVFLILMFVKFLFYNIKKGNIK